MRKKMIMEISSGLLPIGIPDDWVSRLDYKWIMAIGNHKDATITFDEKQWGDFLDDIRKGHEADFLARSGSLKPRLKTDKDAADLATCKDVGNRLMKRNNELEDQLFLENQIRASWEDKANELLKQSESDSDLLKERHDKIDELWKELESKCKECVDVRLELEAAKKENEELRHLHSEDVHRLCVISDPKQGTLFHCKKGHDHFMFDCEGCQYELEEWIDPVKEQSRRAGFLEACDEIEEKCGLLIGNEDGSFDAFVLKLREIKQTKKEAGKT